MGPQAAEGLRGSETLPLAVANIIKSRTRLTSRIICLSQAFSGQRSLGQRKRNITDGYYEVALSSLFHFGGLDQVQEVLFRDGEDLLLSHHECKEALTLF
jgi:hypothetical protein